MFNQLTLHKGAKVATMEDLMAVTPPKHTETYCPVPYGDFVGTVRELLPRFDMKEIGSQFALSPDNQKMFGILKCETNLGDTEGCLAIGLRSSYNTTLAPALIAGRNLFICDNLAFSGEIQGSRKQTQNVFRDLENMVWTTLREVERRFGQMLIQDRKMKEIEVNTRLKDHILMESVRKRAIGLKKVLHVDREFRRDDPKLNEAFGPWSAWRLFNAFTEVYKTRNPWQVAEESTRLRHVFTDVLRLDDTVSANPELN